MAWYSTLNCWRNCKDNPILWKSSLEEKGLGVNMGKTKVLISGTWLDMLQRSGKVHCAMSLSGVAIYFMFYDGCSSWVLNCRSFPITPDKDFADLTSGGSYIMQENLGPNLIWSALPATQWPGYGPLDVWCHHQGLTRSSGDAAGRSGRGTPHRWTQMARPCQTRWWLAREMPETRLTPILGNNEI